MNHEEIVKRLRAPFPSKDVEWKIQVTTQEKSRGMAVAYLDARAVQKRLDETLGTFNWKNVYSLWHDNAQICGISIFLDDRNEWVTKFDGAENSDIEPIKGGLSDSFKRAASVWGIGRYLYELEAIWVEIEPRGKTFAIKQNQYAKLESEYNTAVKQIFGVVPAQKKGNITSTNNTSGTSSGKQSQQAPESKSTSNDKPPQSSGHDFKVHSIKPSGQASQVLELVGNDGKVTRAYVKAADQSIATGAHLKNVQMEKRNSEQGEYNLIKAYQLAA